MFLLVYFCLPEVDLEEGQSVLESFISTHFKDLKLFLILYVLIPLINVIFSLAHETIYILW